MNPSLAEDEELGAAALVRALERPAPAAIAFKEIRFSALLDRPLVVSGELKYLAADHLERLVTNPYRETTTIRGESVRIERQGEKLRTFSLNRAPELRGILMAFSGLLAGDLQAVQREFDVSAEGSQESWSLSLAPHDPRARKQLRELRMTGSKDEPRCFFMTSGTGARSAMLLGAAAHEPLDSDSTADDLTTICETKRAQ